MTASNNARNQRSRELGEQAFLDHRVAYLLCQRMKLDGNRGVHRGYGPETDEMNDVGRTAVRNSNVSATMMS